jgi:quinol monooxygenase YgiN
VHPGKFERVNELLIANAKHAQTPAESGTIAYRFYWNIEQSVVVVYEEYADLAGYEVSRGGLASGP